MKLSDENPKSFQREVVKVIHIRRKTRLVSHLPHFQDFSSSTPANRRPWVRRPQIPDFESSILYPSNVIFKQDVNYNFFLNLQAFRNFNINKTSLKVLKLYSSNEVKRIQRRGKYRVQDINPRKRRSWARTSR